MSNLFSLQLTKVIWTLELFAFKFEIESGNQLNIIYVI